MESRVMEHYKELQSIFPLNFMNLHIHKSYSVPKGNKSSLLEKISKEHNLKSKPFLNKVIILTDNSQSDLVKKTLHINKPINNSKVCYTNRTERIKEINEYGYFSNWKVKKSHLKRNIYLPPIISQLKVLPKQEPKKLRSLFINHMTLEK